MSTVAQTKPKKTAAAKKPLSHPTFAEMITEAITSLKERTGSSQYAITKFIEEKHKDLPPTYRKLVLLHLKKSVASGKLVKVKSSFKLAPAAAKTAPAKTSAATKAPKAATKPSAKAVTKPKAKAAGKPKAKAAAKPKAVAKPKAKSVKATPVKKAVAKKVVKKVKSVKSPAKKVKSVKTPVKKAKK
uniref:His7 protein n=3 Tax=Pisum sativum TaxID=3888 RepID=S6D6F9_PEA|nr:histone H1 subtype 7 [Pisum sativum subsp. jomardii]CCP19598.1 histone H1 subtype 7 [Pisum sativum subsp. transcaucasicum]CCP19606.1 histone H1 subtype 7 [Pisum sativum subsp. elatius]CCP19621.1 histone H1 subtype 7 [Pisum sativum subsp. jomardii]